MDDEGFIYPGTTYELIGPEKDDPEYCRVWLEKGEVGVDKKFHKEFREVMEAD